VKIGDNCMIPFPSTVDIDLCRPCLVEIGDYVRINKNFFLRVHDGGFFVLRHKFKELISASGKVTIGNNVYFGFDCKVFKGVTVGDNCIIGANSVISKSIPANSVAVGSPARVVCTVDEYYQKRKAVYVQEAFAYCHAIVERYGRRPVLADFKSEFPLFLKAHEEPTDLPVRAQMAEVYDHYKEHHVPLFESFDDFLKAAGID